MTTQQQADAVAAYWAARIAVHGANTSLTDEEQNRNTDGCAEVLETVNPNHDYPPTPR